ncbi:Down syndrome cell adhesion molecule-like protein Dscam2 [Gryllus bimaculatus]|nr:Down syndrome cell adhesion molecule-like protein Dscam2 [Gryllus bimaculatus]
MDLNCPKMTVYIQSKEYTILHVSCRFVIGQYVPTNGDVVSHVNITNVRVEDGGTYQCTAVNRAGEMSHSAELNVYGLPRVRPMGDVSAIAGETLSITCPAAGYPIDGIEWFRVSDDGDRVLPYITRQLTFPNGTLMIEKVQSGEDDGLYRCTASNKQGDRASDVAHVTVTVPPKITPFSFRSDLHLGERVGAQCVVSKGDPPLRVHWLKDGRQLSPVDGERGVMVRTLDEFTSVLSIGALSRHHGGNYTCVARNGAAQTAESALLSVNVPPAITPFAFGELSSGERVLVTCSVKRGDPPLTIQWFKDARPIPPTPSLHDDPDLTVQGAGEYSSVLAIRSVSSRHSGNYTCSATNKARTTTYTALLLVTVPPSWIVEPRSGYAKIGGQALLHCKAEGFPPPTIVWKRIPPSRAGERPKEVEVINVRAGALLLPNGTLFLKNVTKDDEGRYICEATNGIGVGLSAVLYLTVNAPVQFKMRSRKEMVRRGTTAILSCHAVGDVPITFVWRKEGSFLELQGRTSAKNVANGLESELRINAVNSDDGGIYTCFARNEYGHDQTEIHLVVQDAPDHPTNVRLVDKGSRRVTIAWTPPLDGNSPITRYVVRHNFVIDLDVLQGPGVETSVEGTQSTAVISPLSPATTYSIQVVAENTLGPGTPSHEILVRTDEEAPSGGPLHLSVDALSSTQLILNWDPPALDQWNGPLLGHYVGYRYIGDMENKKQYNFTTVNFKGNGKEEARLGGLKKYSKYGLVVQAFNSRGPGPLSEEIQGHTLEDVPEAPPRDVRCSALSSESVQVSWQPPPEPLVHGVIQGYRLIYEPILPPTENGGGLFGLMVEFGAEDDEMMQSRTKTTTALTTTLHNLFKYTNYSIELIAFTRVGDGAKSHPMYCRTSEDVPGAPSDIKSVLITNKMTLIAWLPPKQPNGVITKYNIYVRVLEDGRQIDARSVPHTSTTHLQHRYADLNRQRRYEFWVTAFTRIGEGKSSTVAAISPATK